MNTLCTSAFTVFTASSVETARTIVATAKIVVTTATVIAAHNQMLSIAVALRSN